MELIADGLGAAKTRAVGVPVVILKALLNPVTAALAVAVREYPVPTLLIFRLEKVATPLTALTVVVPERVPPPALIAMARVIASVAEVLVMPVAVRTATVTLGLKEVAAVVLDG